MMFALCMFNTVNALFGTYRDIKQMEHEEKMAASIFAFVQEEQEMMHEREDELMAQDLAAVEAFVRQFVADSREFLEKMIVLYEQISEEASTAVDSTVAALAAIKMGNVEIDKILMEAEADAKMELLAFKKQFDDAALNMSKKYTAMYMELSAASQKVVAESYDTMMSDLNALRSEWKQYLLTEFHEVKDLLTDITSKLSAYLGDLIRQINSYLVSMSEETRIKFEEALVLMRDDKLEFREALKAGMKGMAEGSKAYLELMKEYSENEAELEFIFREQLLEYMKYDKDSNDALQLETEELSQALLSDLMSYMNYKSNADMVFELAKMKLENDSATIDDGLQADTMFKLAKIKLENDSATIDDGLQADPMARPGSSVNRNASGSSGEVVTEGEEIVSVEGVSDIVMSSSSKGVASLSWWVMTIMLSCI